MHPSSLFIPETKKIILRLLVTEGPAEAEALSAQLEMHVSVVRRHLEDLHAIGLVDVNLEKKERGRPQNIYSLTIAGRETISSKYDLLLETLVDTLLRNNHHKGKEIFESMAVSIAREKRAPLSMASALTYFSEMEFEPQERTKDGSRCIISKNCPVMRLSRKYPELACDTFHTVLIQKLLEVPEVRLKQAISRGANECIHEISGRLKR